MFFLFSGKSRNIIIVQLASIGVNGDQAMIYPLGYHNNIIIHIAAQEEIPLCAAVKM